MFGNTGLADNGLQRADADFSVIGYGDSDGRVGKSFLHNHVAAPLANLNESMAGQNGANLPVRQNTQLTQRQSPDV